MSDFEHLQRCNSIAKVHKEQREIIATLDRELGGLRREYDAKSRERDHKARARHSVLSSTSVSGPLSRSIPGRSMARTVLSAVAEAVNVADTARQSREIAQLTHEIEALDRELRDLQSNIANADDDRKDAVAEKRRLEARYAELDCPGRILR